MTVIDDYFKKLDPPQRAELQRLRQLVHATAPDAEEVITYGMPGFKYQGKYLVGFNAFADHLSFFPTAEPIAAVKDQLKSYKIAKGTVQFTLEHPLPDALVKQMVTIRINAIKRVR